MTGLPILEIHESQVDGRLRLSLTGELDLASAPVLEDRLARLRALKHPVALDLSKLDFIDGSGLRLLIHEIGEARADGWKLRLEPRSGPASDYVAMTARSRRPRPLPLLRWPFLLGRSTVQRTSAVTCSNRRSRCP